MILKGLSLILNVYNDIQVRSHATSKTEFNFLNKLLKIIF